LASILIEMTQGEIPAPGRSDDMSELIDNSRLKKDVLKHLILQLHEGTAPDAVRAQLSRLMGEVPYGLVVEVEQELISEGTLPLEEVQKLCDVHSAALKGIIDLSGTREPATGHPVEVFRRENRALEHETGSIAALLKELSAMATNSPAGPVAEKLRERFGRLLEVDRHYRRKENLLFPYLEKRGITGPSSVMWAKDDEARAMLKGAMEALEAAVTGDTGSLQAAALLVLQPAAAAVEEMIFKEEQILFPMSLDQLTEAEWRSIAEQGREIGWCLIDPPAWADDPAVSVAAVAGVPAVAPTVPGGAGAPAPGAAGTLPAAFTNGQVRLPSGSFSVEELTRVLNLLPFDLTFVDADDRVRYFTQGTERIFDRNLAILGRKVQQCHPPSSVHIVERIVADFRSGRQDRAPFWIQLQGKFIHIEYFAVRDPQGAYLGTLEVSQDLTALRALTGEQRLLSYGRGPGQGGTKS
jgi:uncharacterized protein